MKKIVSIFMALALSLGIMASDYNTDTELPVNSEKSKVKWLGKKIGGEHWGYIDIKSGAIVVKDGKLTGGEIVIDMTTIVDKDLENEEWNNKLVGHLKSDDFFSVEKYKEATFKTTKVESKGDNSYRVTGDLNIKGATHQNSFDVKLIKENGVYKAKGTLVFDRSKYDVRYGSKTFFADIGDKAIEDKVELTFDLTTK